MLKTKFQLTSILALLGLFLLNPAVQASDDTRLNELTTGLESAHLKHYTGGEDGGLAHVTYWGIKAGDAYYDNLTPEEQVKAGKINANQIHSKLFHPVNADIAGYEVTGLLVRGRREQSITMRFPHNWNGKLVVAGTPGLRNEYANEAIMVPWLLEQGYAYIAGDKGIPAGTGSMLSGNHPTRHWGKMMIDLGRYAQRALRRYSGQPVERTYAMGLSNGGYQTRRALEIDHSRRRALFDGGVDWSGAYWPDKRVADSDNDGHVSVDEYAAANSLIGSIDKGTLAMYWAYSDTTQTTPEEFSQSPPYPGAYLLMTGAGFSPESAHYWGYYNTIFDSFKAVPGFEIFRGVGYYNLVSYAYRAELRGDDTVAAAAYSCYSDPDNPDAVPPVYEWLTNHPHQGWTRKSVRYAMKNANTSQFSAPLISLHGLMDGLVGFNSQAVAYKRAIEKYGNPEQYRLYGIANAGHVDAHADGGGDFNFNGIPGDEEMADRLTPMQAYAMRAFDYLVDWVENSESPPMSTVVPTDPANDIVDPAELSW